ncbi:MAG: sugar ABC transporter permease [Chloroflexi bacterium]|nr:sugar ABC transporter permease [Chloroflexota bacterium]
MAARSRGRWTLRQREALAAYLFLLPWLVGLLVFVLGPVVASFLLAFTSWDLLNPPQWIGLGNFDKMFSGDKLFPISLYNTAYYTFISVPLHVVVALVLALALNLPLRGIRFFRTAFYVPSVTPAVANAILWLWIFQPEVGLLNVALGAFGVPPQRWLFEAELAKPSFIIMSMWASGGQMVIFLAGLQSIPEHLYEAASIDGAGAWRRFLHVTLPMLSPVIFFNLVIGLIGTFQVFSAAYIMTGGGPSYSTLFYVLYLYNNAFKFLQMGYASALAWVLFLIVLFFTLVQFLVAGRWVYYEGELKR